MLLVALTLFVEGVSAQLVTNLFIGSEEMVIRNGLQADEAYVFIQQKLPNGQYLSISRSGALNLSFPTKESFDSQIAYHINRAAAGVIVHNVGQDMDGYFIVSVGAVKMHYEYEPSFGIVYLGGNLGSFKLVKSGGVYSLPDLSRFVVGMPIKATYYFPQLKWARVTTSATQTVDSALETSSLINFGLSSVVLTDTMALSGKVKMSVIYGPDNVYASFDERGALLAETPPSTKMQALSTLVTYTQVRLSFSGGDIGRSYEVESSPDLKTWSLVSDTRFTVFYRFPHAEHTTFTITSEGDNRFYRLRDVNRVPQYPK